MHLKNDGTYRKALNSALRILARRDHSTLELRQKLEAKGHPAEAIRRAVVECQRLGYLNDERTAHAVINRFKHKGCGIRRIRFELRQHGLSSDHFMELLQRGFSPEEELALARRTLARKLNACSAAEGVLAQKSRLHRFLFGRGYSEFAIRTALDELGAVERQDMKTPAK